MKQYKSYKDSGIEWLGEIPSHWTLISMKFYFYMKGRIGWQGLKADEFISDGPYLVTGTDFDNGKVDWSRCYHISDERYNEAPEIHVKAGDLLITKDGTVGKLAYIDHVPGKVSLNSHLLLIRPLSNTVSNHFMYWALQADNFVHYTGLAQNGSIMASLSQEKIGDYKLALPSLSEQRIIASYLDDKVGQIDAVIAEKEKMVEDLQNYRKSVISEAVTRGLNPDVPMKDSGIDWIGMIPEHWQVLKIGYVFDNLDYLREPISSEHRDRKNPQYDYYGASGIIDKIDYYNVDDKVLLIGEDGANLIMRNLPLVYKAEGKFWVNNHAHILKPKLDDYDYLAHVLEAADYSNFITGSAQPKLSQEKLYAVKIPIPPINEQKEISCYLNNSCETISSTINLLQAQIEDLKSYKSSLITEAVTGKIDLR